MILKTEVRQDDKGITVHFHAFDASPSVGSSSDEGGGPD
jgi:hypothetical protein